jgi:hypothetical protein
MAACLAAMGARIHLRHLAFYADFACAHALPTPEQIAILRALQWRCRMRTLPSAGRCGAGGVARVRLQVHACAQPDPKDGLVTP